MTFRENLNRICADRGTTPTRMCKDLKISTSKVTAINNGSIPNEEMMLKFANYLNCSVMDFFADREEILQEVGTIEESAQIYRIDEHSADEEDIIRIYRTLSRRGKHEFMAMVYEFENRE